MGGFWYSSQPLPPDDLYQRILSVADDPSTPNLSRDVERFLSRHPEDTRIDAVKSIKEDVDIWKLQRQFEIRARGRPETGSLSPIEVHCNEAFRKHREGDIAGAIEKLKGVLLLYGNDARSDVRIQRSTELASRLLPKWEEELHQKIIGLQADLETRLNHADEVLKKHPVRAKEIYEGVLKLYADDVWARELYERAKTRLETWDPENSKAIIAEEEPAPESE